MSRDEKAAENLFETISRKVECCICCEIKPMIVTNCGHSVCAECATQITNYRTGGNRSQRYVCPICKQEMQVRKAGWPKNYDLNDIMECIRKIEDPCRRHQCFPSNLKCMSCHEFRICLQCVGEQHLGHLVVNMNQDEEAAKAIWRNACLTCDQNTPLQTSNIKHVDKRDCEKDMPHELDINTGCDTVTPSAPQGRHDTTSEVVGGVVHFDDVWSGHLKGGVMRGDCVLYLYNSADDAERYMGLGLVRRVFDRDEYLGRDTVASDLSMDCNIERPNKKARSQHALSARTSTLPSMLRISRLVPQAASADSTSGDSLQHDSSLSGAPLRPLMESTIDIPIFAVIANGMRVNMQGCLCAESIRDIKKAHFDFGVHFDC